MDLARTSFCQALSAAGSLPERHLAAVVRGLLGRIDQAMQIDRGLEGRMMGFAVADRPGEQRVDLTDVDGFTRGCAGRGEGEALGHRHRR